MPKRRHARDSDDDGGCMSRWWSDMDSTDSTDDKAILDRLEQVIDHQLNWKICLLQIIQMLWAGIYLGALTILAATFVIKSTDPYVDAAGRTFLQWICFSVTVTRAAQADASITGCIISTLMTFLMSNGISNKLVNILKAFFINSCYSVGLLMGWLISASIFGYINGSNENLGYPIDLFGNGLATWSYWATFAVTTFIWTAVFCNQINRHYRYIYYPETDTVVQSSKYMHWKDRTTGMFKGMEQWEQRENMFSSFFFYLLVKSPMRLELLLVYAILNGYNATTDFYFWVGAQGVAVFIALFYTIVMEWDWFKYISWIHFQPPIFEGETSTKNKKKASNEDDDE